MTTCFNTLELNDNRRLVDALLNINPKADPKEFLAILNAQDNLDILEVAAGFASLSKGIRNINMAVSHASKVVTSLKSYSRQDEHDVFA